MLRTTSLLLSALLFLGGALPAWAQASAIARQEQARPALPLERPGAQVDKADQLLALCLMEFALGNLTAAEKHCGDAMVLDPERVDAYKLRAYAYLAERRFERAAEDFRAALRLNSADDQIIGGYAQTLSDMGRYGESVAQFHQALALAPQKTTYWNGLCWAQAGTGLKLDEALAACNKAVRMEPAAAGPYNSRGLVHLRMQRFADAIADYRHSLDLSSDQPSARFGLGLARLTAGDVGGAADIQKARQFAPAIDRLFVGMGLLPDRCDRPGQVTCPPSFPTVPPRGEGDYVVVKAPGPADRDILHMAGFWAP